jgi:hypothetical protein
MAVHLYRLSFMTTQEIYDRKVVTREEEDSALVVLNSATPVITKPTSLQELYDLKSQTRLDNNSGMVVVEV